MVDTLFLRLDHPTPGTTEWRTNTGECGSGTLAEAALVAAGRRVVVFVPGTEVLLSEAAVPTRKREQLLQAVPFFLEEQLAEEVGHLHFALGRLPKSGEGESVPVAVVTRVLMDAWLAALEAAGITPYVLIPDVLALPFSPGTWTLLRDPNISLLRTGLQAGCALDPESLAVALEKAPADILVDDLPCPNGSLALLAEGYRPFEAIDLLQGPYSRREQMSRLWRPWQPAAVLFSIWLAGQVTGLVLEQHQLAAEDLALRTQMSDLYLKTFPDAKRVVNPRTQMEQRIVALRNQPEGGTAGLLGLLAKAVPVLSTTAGVDLRNLRYKEGSIEMDLSLKNLQMLDQLKQHLAETGLEVEIRSARAQGDTVEGHLQIRNKT